MNKTYVGISRDHSGSMSPIAKAAARDYNETIAAIKEATQVNNQDTIVSVVKCGVGSGIVVNEVVNSSINALQPLVESQYDANGSSTPLFDSVGQLIEMFEATPDATNPDVSFLVMATTDGQNNRVFKWNASKLTAKIKQLETTGRWTFVFRVPKGGARSLAQMGIPAGNILEWEQSERGMQVAQAATKEAFQEYYSGRSRGVTSTNKFYVNLKDVKPEEIKAALIDISLQVKLWDVTADAQIKPFVESKLNAPMAKGGAFYQLTKTENEVQDYKQIAIRDKQTGSIYSGAAARQLLGLPTYGMARVSPGEHGQYDVFLQSTSVNRKLPSGTQLLYWPTAGVTK